MLRARAAALAMVLGALVAEPASAVDLWVDPVGGSDTSGDGSREAPFRSITHTARFAGWGTDVRLLPGTYGPASGERFPIIWNEGASLIGSGAATTRVVDGSVAALGLLRLQPALFAPASYTIANIAFEGSGIVKSALLFGMSGAERGHLVLRGCRFRGFPGVAVAVSWSDSYRAVSFTIEGNRFEGGFAGVQLQIIGTLCGSEEHSLLRNNVFVGSAVGVYLAASNLGCSATMYTRVHSNSFLSGTGDAIQVWGGDIDRCEPEVVNNLFVANAGYAISESRSRGTGPRLLAANLFWGNGLGAYYDRALGALASAGEVNLLPASDPSHPSIDGDPRLADLAGGDFHLQAGSPAIDAGDSARAPAADHDGESRPFDGDGDAVAHADIGADEWFRADLRRGILPSLVPAGPALAVVYPFWAANPLTPVARAGFVPGDSDPDLGILTRPGTPLALYQIEPSVLRALWAVKQTSAATVRFDLAP